MTKPRLRFRGNAITGRRNTERERGRGHTVIEASLIIRVGRKKEKVTITRTGEDKQGIRRGRKIPKV